MSLYSSRIEQSGYFPGPDPINLFCIRFLYFLSICHRANILEPFPIFALPPPFAAKQTSCAPVEWRQHSSPPRYIGLWARLVSIHFLGIHLGLYWRAVVYQPTAIDNWDNWNCCNSTKIWYLSQMSVALIHICPVMGHAYMSVPYFV